MICLCPLFPDSQKYFFSFASFYKLKEKKKKVVLGKHTLEDFLISVCVAWKFNICLQGDTCLLKG